MVDLRKLNLQNQFKNLMSTTPMLTTCQWCQSKNNLNLNMRVRNMRWLISTICHLKNTRFQLAAISTTCQLSTSTTCLLATSTTCHQAKNTRCQLATSTACQPAKNTRCPRATSMRCHHQTTSRLCKHLMRSTNLIWWSTTQTRCSNKCHCQVRTTTQRWCTNPKTLCLKLLTCSSSTSWNKKSNQCTVNKCLVTNTTLISQMKVKCMLQQIWDTLRHHPLGTLRCHQLGKLLHTPHRRWCLRRCLRRCPHLHTSSLHRTGRQSLCLTNVRSHTMTWNIVRRTFLMTWCNAKWVRPQPQLKNSDSNPSEMTWLTWDKLIPNSKATITATCRTIIIFLTPRQWLT